MHLSAVGEHIYHPVDWHSATHSRVSLSTIRAEILAAAYYDGLGSLILDCIADLRGCSAKYPFTLSFISQGLYSTTKTLHEENNYSLQPTVASLRDSFEVGELEVVQWIPEKLNLVDAFTKRNINSYRDLGQVAASATLSPQRFEKAQKFTISS